MTETVPDSVSADSTTGIVFGRFVRSAVDGTKVDSEGEGVPGVRLEFRPTTQALISDPDRDVTYTPGPTVITADDEGRFSARLLATDLPNATVSGWRWDVTVHVPVSTTSSAYGARSYSLRGIEVRAGSEQWLADVTPSVDAGTGEIVTRGRDGASAYDLAVSRGYEGTQAEFAAMLALVTPSSVDLGEVSGPVALDVLNDLVTLDAAGELFTEYGDLLENPEYTYLHLPQGSDDEPIPDGLDLAVHVRSGNNGVKWADGARVDTLPVPDAPEAWYWAVRENGAWHVKVQQDLFWSSDNERGFSRPGPLAPAHMAGDGFQQPVSSFQDVTREFIPGYLSNYVPSDSVYDDNITDTFAVFPSVRIVSNHKENAKYFSLHWDPTSDYMRIRTRDSSYQALATPFMEISANGQKFYLPLLTEEPS